MQRAPKKLLRMAAVAVVATLLAAACTMTLYGLHIRHHASSLLADVTKLKPGKSNASDAQRVIDRHRKLLDLTECADSSCQYRFTITNDWFYRLKVEPGALFRVWVVVQDGTVTRISAALFRDTRIFPTFPSSGGVADEYTELPEHAATGTPVGKPYLRLAIDRNASPQIREMTFAFSFKCLTKPGGGCDLPCDYLPQAWKEWKRMHIEGRADGQRMFDELYPNNQRCE